MTSLLELSAEQLIARGIAPVKKEYILQFTARKPVEAVAGSAATAANGAVSAKKKSKNQIKKERFESSKAELCTNFALGRCAYGASCKFNHDTAAYLAAKPVDLPGACPFTLLEACPYGITCRWAGTHKVPPQPAAAAPAAAPVEAADPASESTAEPAAKPGTQPTAEPEAQTAAEPASELKDQPASEAPAAAAAGLHQVVHQLPPINDLQQPINTLSKQLQQMLWKRIYDFGQADAVLAGLGCSNNSSSGGPSGGGRGRKRQQPGKTADWKNAGGKDRAGEHSQQQQQQQHDGVVAPAGAAAAAAAAAGVPAGEGPPAKKPHLDETVAAAATAVAEVAEVAAAAAAAAAAVTAAAATAAADSAMHDLDGLYEAVDKPAAPRPAPAAAAGTAGSPTAAAVISSDASFISKLSDEQQQQQQQRVGAAGVDALNPASEPRSKPRLDIAGKTYLAPLTTVGNLPFRRLCVGLGCEVTCGEMALATNLLSGQASEWALLKRHPCEKYFGVQVCGGYPDAMSHLAQLLDENLQVDFVDINCGCPIDIICSRGAGSALLTRPNRLEQVVRATTACINKPVIVKIRKGYYDDTDVAHSLIPQLPGWGAAAVTLHGRSRQQRYSRAADWEYISRCAGIAAEAGLPLVGNGDVFSYSEWTSRLSSSGVTTAMIGRAALIKPWIFTEIQEQRLWDISASERLDILKQFVSHGLEHWGSDSRGVENTRRFLLEWLSFTHRYIPVGLLEVTPQVVQWRPPAYRGRNELESLLGSESAADWVRISEMLLGPAPPGFSFSPKHKSNAYAASADAVGQAAGAAAAAGQQGGEAGEAAPAGAEEQENG